MSANQGRLLNKKIAELETKIEESASPTILGSGTVHVDNNWEYVSTPACDYVVLTFSKSNSHEYICTPGASVTMSLGYNFNADVTLNSEGTQLTFSRDITSDAEYINWVAYG